MSAMVGGRRARACLSRLYSKLVRRMGCAARRRRMARLFGASRGLARRFRYPRCRGLESGARASHAKRFGRCFVGARSSSYRVF